MLATSIGDALFTKTQQRVLALLYGKPEQSFYTNEIVRWADMGRGTIRRELERLVSSGLLVVTRVGNQLHYQANTACPIHKELLGIVRKTFGLCGVIKEALFSLSDQIEWVFIFGSVASGKETSLSDIDLMIIGDVGFSDAVKALYPVQDALHREVNPKIYSKKEWIQMHKTNDAFIKEVLAKPRMDVMGNADELGQLSR
ncbi:MAG: nucleotidyltransferase domain-containing protein [Sulfuriflexus sp.]|nr:nucleotidyltransferase domain-containing protein [Sulfuriflexus sp.]